MAPVRTSDGRTAAGSLRRQVGYFLNINPRYLVITKSKRPNRYAEMGKREKTELSQRAKALLALEAKLDRQLATLQAKVRGAISDQ